MSEQRSASVSPSPPSDGWVPLSDATRPQAPPTHPSPTHADPTHPSRTQPSSTQPGSTPLNPTQPSLTQASRTQLGPIGIVVAPGDAQQSALSVEIAELCVRSHRPVVLIAVDDPHTVEPLCAATCDAIVVLPGAADLAAEQRLMESGALVISLAGHPDPSGALARLLGVDAGPTTSSDASETARTAERSAAAERSRAPVELSIEHLERVVREQQLVAARLLRHDTDAWNLDWIEATGALAACVSMPALGETGGDMLEVVGWAGDHRFRDLPAPSLAASTSTGAPAGPSTGAPAEPAIGAAAAPSSGTGAESALTLDDGLIEVGSFPPRSLVDTAATERAITVVVPVPGGARGHLAVVEPLAEFGEELRVRVDAIRGWGQLLGNAAELDERLRHTTLFDSVTGLANRRHFRARLDASVVRCQRFGTPFAVAFLDLDNFKVVNDAFGHEAGDALLTRIADRLRRTARRSDVAARIGGDEFAVLMVDTDAGDAMAVVDRYRSAIAEPIEVEGHELRVTASFGVAMSSTGYSSAAAVLRDADTAMYNAKAEQRGACSVFDVEMHQAAIAKVVLLKEIRSAFDNDEFELFFQPIFDSDVGDVDHFEALVRWRHPERGLVPPGVFLPVMLEAGLAVELGRCVVGLACRQLQTWSTEGFDPRISINVSHAEFWDHSTIRHIVESCAVAGVEPRRLIVEVTEDIVAGQPDDAIARMEALRDAGFDLHVDDFGIGSSSLHALYRYPVKGLKIDRSFVNRLGEDERMTALVRSICEMGTALELDIVAEGVEYPDQIALLRQLGCTKLQGFALAKPMPAEQAVKLLHRTN